LQKLKKNLFLKALKTMKKLLLIALIGLLAGFTNEDNSYEE
jgi:hypothetical protein